MRTRDQRREGNTRDYKALLVLMFYVWLLALVPSIRLKDITARRFIRTNSITSKRQKSLTPYSRDMQPRTSCICPRA